MTKPTRTGNPFHFGDLAPKRFEDHSYQLVSRVYTWEKINHEGRAGSDDCADTHIGA
jgi:hypothetical protein